MRAFVHLEYYLSCFDLLNQLTFFKCSSTLTLLSFCKTCLKGTVFRNTCKKKKGNLFHTFVKMGLQHFMNDSFLKLAVVKLALLRRFRLFPDIRIFKTLRCWYEIIESKFKNFNSAVCTTPRSQTRPCPCRPWSQTRGKRENQRAQR